MLIVITQLINQKRYVTKNVNKGGKLKMAKLQKHKKQFTVTIPEQYIKQAKWKKGDLLTVSSNKDGNIELAKVKSNGKK